MGALAAAHAVRAAVQRLESLHGFAVGQTRGVLHRPRGKNAAGPRPDLAPAAVVVRRILDPFADGRVDAERLASTQGGRIRVQHVVLRRVVVWTGATADAVDAAVHGQEALRSFAVAEASGTAHGAARSDATLSRPDLAPAVVVLTVVLDALADRRLDAQGLAISQGRGASVSNEIPGRVVRRAGTAASAVDAAVHEVKLLRRAVAQA
mmetsp:Transcript_83891/g.271494  ORF Transcript_83891/g.271494 Transcript_83891/m.271494 type:complete len:208 (+) Transcript_83891:1275-1898(+)